MPEHRLRVAMTASAKTLLLRAAESHALSASEYARGVLRGQLPDLGVGVDEGGERVTVVLTDEDRADLMEFCTLPGAEPLAAVIRRRLGGDRQRRLEPSVRPANYQSGSDVWIGTELARSRVAAGCEVRRPEGSPWEYPERGLGEILAGHGGMKLENSPPPAVIRWSDGVETSVPLEWVNRYDHWVDGVVAEYTTDAAVAQRDLARGEIPAEEAADAIDDLRWFVRQYQRRRPLKGRA